jgi:IS1 family transposase
VAPGVRQRPVPPPYPARPRAGGERSGDLTVEADELWSFVGENGRLHRVRAALGTDARRVVGTVVGGRSEDTARRLWEALPCRYRDRAIVCTDPWPAYRAAVPDERHAAAGEDEGRAAPVERLWCTLRRRCGRFARKTRPFPKCPRNHLGALWHFTRLYNRSRRDRP